MTRSPTAAPAPLVLGLNTVHPDSSAALAGPDGLIAAIAEERVSRQKHSAAFPEQAIDEVLRIAGASRADITDVAIARDPRANMNARILYLSAHPAYRPGAPARPVPKVARNVVTAGQGEDRLIASLPRARAHRVEHHLAHIASAFYCSGLDRAAALSVDGVGDWCTLMIARCTREGVQVLKRCHPPHSLGIFYTALSGFLGFRRYSEEYKVMGLSATGEDRYAAPMAELVGFDPSRGIRLNTACFAPTSASIDAISPEGLVAGELLLPRMFTPELERLLGPPREPGAPLEQRHRDIACSLQRRFERVYLDLVAWALRLTGEKDLVMAGGCTHNAVANGLLLSAGLCRSLYMHPAAGDDGTSVGAALHVLHRELGVPVPGRPMGAYWGPSWDEGSIRGALEQAGLGPARPLDQRSLIAAAADALAAGKVVGWFQGREEWGPRALGNRSILAHPGAPGMKDTLNERVKHRERFRPFAPAVLAERLGELYEGSHPVPFMNVVYKTRADWRSRLASVVHDDGTGRVQTVSGADNPVFRDLLEAFESRTGLPVLLNTSFNENEPIVHTPAEAVDCFRRTRMDCLGIGPFWITKG
jgi:carbamoyltransferase